MKPSKTLIVAVITILAPHLLADDSAREQIGTVLGEPVYRDQIRDGDNWKLRSELHRLFTAPVMEQYREKHEVEVTPTEKEILAALRHFRHEHEERIKDEKAELQQRLRIVNEQLAADDLDNEAKKKLAGERSSLQARLRPPRIEFARWYLSQWKLQHHLYEKFGGGRILFQQAGLEAFDAMHGWLKQQQDQGKFRIDDPELKQAFYHYWEGMNHGAFLSDPQKSPEIGKYFLDPPWRNELEAAIQPPEQE